MTVKRVENPGEDPQGAPTALPMFCYAGWASWVNPDAQGLDIQEQARRLMIHGEAMQKAGEALREVAEREAARRDG